MDDVYRYEIGYARRMAPTWPSSSLRAVLVAVVALVIAALPSRADAANRTATQSGDWNVGDTWGGTVPLSTDFVTIPAGITVTIPSGSSVQHQAFVEVFGTLTNAGTFTAYDLRIREDGTFTSSDFANMVGTFDNDGTTTNGGLFISSGGSGPPIKFNRGSFTNTASGELRIIDKFVTSGELPFTNHGSIENSNTFDILSPFENYGTVTNTQYRSLKIFRDLHNHVGAALINENNGQVFIQGGVIVTNDGAITNMSGTVDNQGTLINSCTGVVTGAITGNQPQSACPTPTSTSTALTPTPTLSATPTPTETPDATKTPTATQTADPAATGAATPTVVPTPSAETNRKCRTAIVKSSAAFAQARIAALQKCEAQRLSGKVIGACADDAKTSGKIAKTIQKLHKSIAKSCGGSNKRCGAGDTGSDADIARIAIGFPASCPRLRGACVAPVAEQGCEDIATCLACLGRVATDQAIALDYDVVPADPKAAKPLNKCQQTIGKSAVGFFIAKSKTLAKCWAKVSAGKLAGPCPDGASAAVIAAAAARRNSGIAKACCGKNKSCNPADTGADADFDATVEIGFRPTCDAVFPPGASSCETPTADVQSVATCVGCFADFAVGCLDAAQVPAFVAPYPVECQ